MQSKPLNPARALLLYVGIVAGTLLSLSWYISIRDADPTYKPNMGPWVIVLAPALAIPTLFAALLIEGTVFQWLRAFRWSVVWFLLGVAYGGFWSCYAFMSSLSSPVAAIFAGVLVALLSALAVRLVARQVASRIAG